jgi:predicted transposase/invertase (TIGR01784 family)
MAKKLRKPRRPHDLVHRRIFTHPRMIEEILRRFVTGPWASQLDYSTLELVPAHYVSRFLSQRESDVVWKVRYGPAEDEWFFVYILIELQSSVQRFMALRLWVYVALFYQHLLKAKQLTASS